MANLLACRSELSAYTPLRNFGGLSCGISNSIRLFNTLSNETPDLASLSKPLLFPLHQTLKHLPSMSLFNFLHFGLYILLR